MVKHSLLPAVFFFAILGCGSTTETTPKAPPENVLSCSQPAACGLVSANSDDPASPPATEYTTAQACALWALPKGKPVRIDYVFGCEGMCYGESLLVRSDGSVIVQGFFDTFNDDGFDVGGLSVEFEPFSESELCTLEPASYFEKCLSTFDESCASSSKWVTGCASPAPASCTP